MRSGNKGLDRIVLDTSAFSRFRAGHTEVFEVISSAEIARLPVIVLGELEAGFELGKRAKSNRVSLADFLSEPFVSVLSITISVSTIYGKVFAELKRNGTPIPLNDIWIAATTLETGGHLVTFDRHFKKIKGLSFTLYNNHE